MPTQIRDLKGSTQHREFLVEQRMIDEEGRTVELAFSSELPVDRMFFEEVLSHDSSAVRLGRINDGAPLLVEHDRRLHAGAIVRN